MKKDTLGFILLGSSFILSIIFRILWFSGLGFIVLMSESSPYLLTYIDKFLLIFEVIGIILILIEHHKNSWVLIFGLLLLLSIPINTFIGWWQVKDLTLDGEIRNYLLISYINYLDLLMVAFIFTFFKKVTQFGKIMMFVYLGFTIFLRLLSVILPTILNQMDLVHNYYIVNTITHIVMHIILTIVMIVLFDMSLDPDKVK